MKPVIVTRLGKGSRLTPTEGDANFTNLQNATISITDGTHTKAIDLNGTITFNGAHNTAVSVDSATGTITIDTSIPTAVSAFTNDSGYITGYTETDPIFVASPAHGITNTNITNWNTAFGYGNHATAGYLTSFTETDPVFSAWNKSTGISITKSQVSDFGSYQAPLVSGTNIRTVNGQSLLGSTDLTITSGGLNSLVDDTAPQLGGNISTNGFSIWNLNDGSINDAAHNGGNLSLDITAAFGNVNITAGTNATEPSNVNITSNFAINNNAAVYIDNIKYPNLSQMAAGYVLTSDGVNTLSLQPISFTETDPVFVSSAAHSITSGDITNWNTSYSWGNFASAIGLTIQGYSSNLNGWSAISPSNKQDTLVSGTNIKTVNGNSLTGAGNIVISAGNGLGSLTAYKADGTQDNIDITANTTLDQLTISQEQVVSTNMHYAIDTTASYGWNDITSEINVKGSGVNNPTWGLIRNGLYAYTFSATVMNECWCAFHIPHSYTPGTDVFLHTHWVNPSTNTGVVRWGFEYSFAKGYGREVFPSTTTVYVEQASAGQYSHNIAEISAGILGSSLEVDGILYVRIFRDAAHANDTNTNAVALLTADVHHQTSRWATKSRSYPFY